MTRHTVILAALLLTGCATPPPTPSYTQRLQRVELPPMDILIDTVPPGGLIDRNGDVLGIAPITLTITPVKDSSGLHSCWPTAHTRTEVFRARWPGGDQAIETFPVFAPPPERIVLMSSMRVINWGDPPKKTLTQKTGQ